MSYTHLILEKKGPVATITLNRPEKCNALNIKLSAELADAVNNVKMDDNLKIVSSRGQGGISPAATILPSSRSGGRPPTSSKGANSTSIPPTR